MSTQSVTSPLAQQAAPGALPARVTVLSGGVGGARFLQGLLRLVERTGSGTEVTVVANTADDIWVHGLKVCPDLDTVMYTLGEGIDPERGWGRTAETWHAKEELAAYGVKRLVSSSARRCWTTLAPYGSAYDREIEVTDHLSEAGAHPDRVTPVPCDDVGSAADVDTPADLAALAAPTARPQESPV